MPLSTFTTWAMTLAAPIVTAAAHTKAVRLLVMTWFSLRLEQELRLQAELPVLDPGLLVLELAVVGLYLERVPRVVVARPDAPFALVVAVHQGRRVERAVARADLPLPPGPQQVTALQEPAVRVEVLGGPAGGRRLGLALAHVPLAGEVDPLVLELAIEAPHAVLEVDPRGGAVE